LNDDDYDSIIGHGSGLMCWDREQNLNLHNYNSFTTLFSWYIVKTMYNIYYKNKNRKYIA